MVVLLGFGMVYGVLWLTISENSWDGLCGFGILLKQMLFKESLNGDFI
ncbi:hypothetical protein [Xanthomarina gelatinilytica]